MSDVIPIDLDPDGGHIVEPPIVDALQYDRSHNAWVVTLIPEDSVSHREKELVTIPFTSEDGRRITFQVARLSQLLGLKLRELIHRGDGDFVFISDDGSRRELAQPHGRLDLSMRAYVLLADIAMTAQIAFGSQQAIAPTR